jgi:uncharacterized protein YdeI (YjbR/CyaY-like superfamily)
MHAAGLRAHASRQEARSRVYAYEQRKTAELPPPLLARFKRHRKAWSHFQAQPPSYRRTAVWWVISAKKEETRERSG